MTARNANVKLRKLVAKIKKLSRVATRTAVKRFIDELRAAHRGLEAVETCRPLPPVNRLHRQPAHRNTRPERWERCPMWAKTGELHT